MLEDEFRKARSRCIEYQGKTVCLYDVIEVPAECRLKVRFESTNSEWRQGIFLGFMARKTDLRLTVGDVAAPALELWADTSPPEVLVHVRAPGGIVHVYNKWQKPGDFSAWSQLFGAGMLIEVSENGRFRRYRCNDGHPEPTFDHLVFSIEILDPS